MTVQMDKYRTLNTFHCKLHKVVVDQIFFRFICFQPIFILFHPEDNTFGITLKLKKILEFIH